MSKKLFVAITKYARALVVIKSKSITTYFKDLLTNAQCGAKIRPSSFPLLFSTFEHPNLLLRAEPSVSFE